MDETRKLLDSLMGQSRDMSLEEAKKNKGQNFKQDNVCKFYLLGFCPQHELQKSKLVSKRNLGECHKVHSDAMKKEYEQHPDKEKYRTEYERQFLPFLEAQIREADAWVARERSNAQKSAGAEKVTLSSMPDSVKAQVAALTEDMNKMMGSAEELAEKGDIEGSKFKVMLADEIKSKIAEIEEEHPSYEVTLKEEWVCEVCGTRTEAVTENNTVRFQAHFTGKVHVGYAKIREWVKNIRKRMRDAEVSRSSKEMKEDKEKDEKRQKQATRDDKDTKAGDTKAVRRSRSRSRRREDRRDRDRDRGRDRDRRRSQDRDRDRDDRGRRR